MKVDIYDFDKTAVPYDSAMQYFKWSMVHYPWTLILLPFQIFWGFLALTKIIKVETFKKYCFNFVALIPTEKSVKKFWDSHEKDIYPFFKKENRSKENKTVLISASPDFLIKEIANRMDVDYCIATHHNPKNGHLDDIVCRREQKAKRFNDLGLNAEIEAVYSDNKEDDKYIFKLGKKCLLASHGELKDITKDFLE